MRIIPESDGFTLNSILNQRGRSPGEWFRGTLQRLRRNSTPVSVNDPPSPDGNVSPAEEEAAAAEVIPTFEELLEAGHLKEAWQHLIERENCLSETTDIEQRSDEEGKLTEDRNALEKVLLQTFEKSLSLSPEEIHDEASVSALTTVLTSAVKAMYLEDERYLLPKWCRERSNWKELHDSTLRSLVDKRMNNPLVIPIVDQAEYSSVQEEIHSLGRQLKDDLLFVVNVVKSCYPPEANICQFYASLYHQHFKVKLRNITEWVLLDNDHIFVLRWVNEYYPGIFQHPELASEIDYAALGKLMHDNLLFLLEDQYIVMQQKELLTYMDRILGEEKLKWLLGQKPRKEDGCYTSPMAYDIIQIINGMVTVTDTVTGHHHNAKDITEPLVIVLHKYRFLQLGLQRSKEGSPEHIKASFSCMEQFRDVLQNKTHLFPEIVQKLSLETLSEMKISTHTYFLSHIHKTLKPQYQKLGTNDWLKKENEFENFLSSLEKELQNLQDVPPLSRQELVGECHQDVTAEYVRRLLRGNIKLKDQEQQLRAYTTIAQNAEALNQLFSTMGSKEDWLKEILIKIAEVLRLQDVPALQMQIASLGSAHPDLSEKHVSALLKLKANVSKTDRKKITTTLSDILQETSAGDDTQLFFSKV